ncbi:MAG: DNA recombination protein RmuC [Actinomycetes bacterium]
MNSSVGILIGIAIGLVLGLLLGQSRAKNRSHATMTEVAALSATLQTEVAKLAAEQARSQLLAAQLATLQSENSQNIRLDEALKAVTEKMTTLTTQTSQAELNRTRAEAALKEQMEGMKLGNESLLLETTKLAGALSNSATRGKYGEAQLERLLEDSGLLEGVHFFKQDYQITENRASKPDIKIAIPGGAEIFIDSKFPFDRFLEGVVEKDKTKRAEIMAAHAKDLMGHVTALSKRGYSDGSQSPDYVVLFAPFESILSEALDADPGLLNKAFEKGVTIATPTTMMALLRTVAFVFSQSAMAHNAETIRDLASDLIKRIGKVHEKIAKLGNTIKSSERAFNDLVASTESRMLIPARKMMKLGVPSSSKLKALEGIEDETRPIKSPDLLELEDLGEGEDDFDSEVEENDHHDI